MITIFGVNFHRTLFNAYYELVSKIKFAIFPYSSKKYKYTASGAFLDAVSEVRPSIVLKTPLFEDYFSRMGDIGYMCEEYICLFNTTMNIIQDSSKSDYFEKQENIMKGRNIFTPAAIAPHLKEVVEKRF